MKKVRKVFVKTTVIGRSGKSIVHTPLTVDMPASTPSSMDKSSDKTMKVSCSDDHVAEDVVFNPSSTSEDSAAHRRNISSFCNWEKIRPILIKARIEDYSFAENAVCGVCANVEACVRCQYCGPKQIFCESCALSVHETRNQFHVMEKWMVIIVLPVFYSTFYMQHSKINVYTRMAVLTHY